MNLRILASILFLPLTAVAGASAANAEETPPPGGAPDGLLEKWTVVDGDWEVENGTLSVRNGGTIVFNIPPGGRFEMEFEILFPGRWVSVILFYSGENDYGTLYLGSGWWETFEMKGTQLFNYVQNKDEGIIRTGEFQRIKVWSEFGYIHFSYDGVEKGPAVLPYRPGARVGFRSLPDSGTMRIRDFRISAMDPERSRPVRELNKQDFAAASVHRDYQFGEQPVGDFPRLEGGEDSVELAYRFEPGRVFESGFARIPVEVAAANAIRVEAEGDNSNNSLFLIIHDASGEQHLVFKSTIGWEGWQDIGVDLDRFLRDPGEMQRMAVHWGGNRSQRIDFPITAIDIGVAKGSSNTSDSGTVTFRNIRFLE